MSGKRKTGNTISAQDSASEAEGSESEFEDPIDASPEGRAAPVKAKRTRSAATAVKEMAQNEDVTFTEVGGQPNLTYAQPNPINNNNALPTAQDLLNYQPKRFLTKNHLRLPTGRPRASRGTGVKRPNKSGFKRAARPMKYDIIGKLVFNKNTGQTHVIRNQKSAIKSKINLFGQYITALHAAGLINQDSTNDYIASFGRKGRNSVVHDYKTERRELYWQNMSPEARMRAWEFGQRGKENWGKFLKGRTGTGNMLRHKIKGDRFFDTARRAETQKKANATRLATLSANRSRQLPKGYVRPEPAATRFNYPEISATFPKSRFYEKIQ
jgi:hypothetical protein